MDMTTPDFIHFLFDDGSFQEMHKVETGGDTAVIVGIGNISGKATYLIADFPGNEVPKDFFIITKKKVEFLKFVRKNPHPLVVFLNRATQLSASESSKLYVPKGSGRTLMDGDGIGRYFSELGLLSGQVPSVAIVAGDMSAGFVFPASFCDACLFIRGTHIALAGAVAVEKIVGKKVNVEELSGAEMHCKVSGTGDFIMNDYQEAAEWVKKYFSYLPNHYLESAPHLVFDQVNMPEELKHEVLPFETRQAFDMKEVIKGLVDKNSFFELKADYASEIVTGFARIEGRSIGFVGNNSMVRFGAIYPESCRKIAKFSTVCDAFGLPLVFLADTPGFMVGQEIEQKGVIKHATLVLSALAGIEVLKIFVVIRKAYGGGIFVMSGPGFADKSFVLPKAIVGPFGTEVMIEPRSVEERAGYQELKELNSPQKLVENGYIDEIVEWKNLRKKLSNVFQNEKVSAPKHIKKILSF